MREVSHEVGLLKTRKQGRFDTAPQHWFPAPAFGAGALSGVCCGFLLGWLCCRNAGLEMESMVLRAGRWISGKELALVTSHHISLAL